MQDHDRGQTGRFILRFLSFTAFGILAFANPTDPYNVYALVFGALIGLIFGFLFRFVLLRFLNLFNRQIKKKEGAKATARAVSRGILFLFPFAVMAWVSFHYLGWYMTSAFLSAGIMSAGVAASMEMGKLTKKAPIRNTLITSLFAAGFSGLWIFASTSLAGLPTLIEGALTLVFSQASSLF